MTIEQTIEIPADHRVFLEFLAPKEIPAGLARVELKLTPVSEKQDKPFPSLKILAGAATPLADSLLGVAANLGNITLDEIREERLARYLK